MLDGFMRVLAAVMSALYLFGFAWYPSLAPYALVDLACAFGLALRCGMSGRVLLSLRGLVIALVVASLVLVDQSIMVMQQYSGRMLPQFAVILAVLCIAAFDIFRYCKLRRNLLH